MIISYTWKWADVIKDVFPSALVMAFKSPAQWELNTASVMCIEKDFLRQTLFLRHNYLTAGVMAWWMESWVFQAWHKFSCFTLNKVSLSIEPTVHMCVYDKKLAHMTMKAEKFRPSTANGIVSVQVPVWRQEKPNDAAWG